MRHFTCLRQSHSSIQLSNAIIETQYRMLFHTSVISFMIMPMIGIAVCGFINGFIVRYHYTTFTCCRYFKKIK